MACSIKSINLKYCLTEAFAGIAQLVERNLAKVEVASSNLVSRSIFFSSLSSLAQVKASSVEYLISSMESRAVTLNIFTSAIRL